MDKPGIDFRRGKVKRNSALRTAANRGTKDATRRSNGPPKYFPLLSASIFEP